MSENFYYTKTHQWYDPDSGKVGITDYASEQLGEISFVDVEPLNGIDVSQIQMDGDEPASDPLDAAVESNKAIGDVYSPVSGTVTEVNDDLLDYPERVNEDPFGEGWLFVVDASDFEGEKGNLLDAAAYKEFCASLD